MNLVGIMPLVILAVVIAVMLVSGRGAAPHRDDPDEDELRRREPSNWIGPFYRNPNDPNLFVPKQFGLGRTVNLGRPLGVLLILVPMVLAVVLALFTHR